LCYLLDMKTICFLYRLGDLKDINFIAYYLFKLTGIDELQTCSARYNIVKIDSKAAIEYKLWSKFAVQSGRQRETVIVLCFIYYCLIKLFCMLLLSARRGE